MKNKAQLPGLGFSIIVAIVLFIVGMLVVNFIRDDITLARNSDNMDCSNPSISDASKLTCLAIDIVIPYFIVIIVSAAGGYITSRFVI